MQFYASMREVVSSLFKAPQADRGLPHDRPVQGGAGAVQPMQSHAMLPQYDPVQTMPVEYGPMYVVAPPAEPSPVFHQPMPSVRPAELEQAVAPPPGTDVSQMTFSEAEHAEQIAHHFMGLDVTHQHAAEQVMEIDSAAHDVRGAEASNPAPYQEFYVDPYGPHAEAYAEAPTPDTGAAGYYEPNAPPASGLEQVVAQEAAMGPPPPVDDGEPMEDPGMPEMPFGM